MIKSNKDLCEFFNVENISCIPVNVLKNLLELLYFDDECLKLILLELIAHDYNIPPNILSFKNANENYIKEVTKFLFSNVKAYNTNYFIWADYIKNYIKYITKECIIEAFNNLDCADFYLFIQSLSSRKIPWFAIDPDLVTQIVKCNIDCKDLIPITGQTKDYLDLIYV
jgi:hypothetical protein